MSDNETPPGTDLGIDLLTPAELQQMLADEQQARLEQEAELADLKKMVASLAKRTTSVENNEPKPVVITPPTLREGHVRYRHRFSEAVLVKQGAWTTVVDGRPIRVHAQQAEFEGGVYETDDPEMIEWLSEHPDLGNQFWVDPLAVKSHSNVQIVEGPRQSEGHPRNPLEVAVPN